MIFANVPKHKKIHSFIKTLFVNIIYKLFFYHIFLFFCVIITIFLRGYIWCSIFFLYTFHRYWLLNRFWGEDDNKLMFLVSLPLSPALSHLPVLYGPTLDMHPLKINHIKLVKHSIAILSPVHLVHIHPSLSFPS